MMIWTKNQRQIQPRPIFNLGVDLVYYHISQSVHNDIVITDTIIFTELFNEAGGTH